MKNTLYTISKNAATNTWGVYLRGRTPRIGPDGFPTFLVRDGFATRKDAQSFMETL